MTQLQLPALRGDSVLGFLAAVGTVRLLTQELGLPSRIGWPDGLYSGVVLESEFESVDRLAQRIGELVVSMRASGRLLPGVDEFPPAQAAPRVDPLTSLTLTDGRRFADLAMADPSMAHWVGSMVGLSPAIERRTGTIGPLEVNRFLRAGPGTVISVGMLQKALAGASAGALRAAFVRWQRTDGYLGGYLDAVADVDKATGQAEDDPPKRGVHGATFLAFQAIPLFPVRTVSIFKAETVGWMDRGQGRKAFCWPLWSSMLLLPAVAALLDHPEVAAAHDAPDPGRLRALGLIAVLHSARAAAGNNDGAMRPATIRWELVE